MKCFVDDEVVAIGNMAWMLELGITVSPDAARLLTDLQSSGKTAVLVSVASRLTGILAVADKIRTESKAVVAELQNRGIEVWMVTGDNYNTAQAIAKEAGISQVFADVMPADKAEKVKKLQDRGLITAMVGDGINDAPGLAQADVGVAIGAGTEVAIESADVVLMNSSLWDLLVAIDISMKTFRRIKLNFFWAFAYNCAAIPYAAGLFYPATKTLLPPWVAGLAMALSSVSVVLSSLQLKWYKKPVGWGRRSIDAAVTGEGKEMLVHSLSGGSNNCSSSDTVTSVKNSFSIVTPMQDPSATGRFKKALVSIV